MAPSTLEMRIAARLKDFDYRTWRSKVEAVGGCSAPVHLKGEYAINRIDTGERLSGISGRIFVPCNNRRESVCAACSQRYAADCFHLIRDGLSGGKEIPATVANKPRLFVTLTAPSFGPVHTRTVTRSGIVLPCRCGVRHRGDDPRVSTALDPETYDYRGAVLWQAHAGELWHRFIIRLRRYLARAAGITVREFPQHARISYAKVAEYQRRGLVHFHAVIRLDGPHGPYSPAPHWAHPEILSNVIETAAAATTITKTLPVSEGVERAFTFAWGDQLDVRAIQPADSTPEDSAGVITDQALAGYIAKYATKGTSTREAADRPIGSLEDIDNLNISAHHKRMMRTAWDLGGLEGLGHVRAWTHMLGFRGHFLTKSVAYSTRFEAMRNARRLYRYTETLDRLGVTEDEITVINHWQHTGQGYRDDAERELASAIYERRRNQQNTNNTKENSS